jgi:hypothetical protein
VQVVGRVERLHRYPVKSLRGESPEEVEVDRRGVLADRRWALREPDGKLGSGKSTRRFRAMDGLGGLHARLVGGAPVVTFPDGRVLSPGAALDDALTGHVGRPGAAGQGGGRRPPRRLPRAPGHPTRAAGRSVPTPRASAPTSSSPPSALPGSSRTPGSAATSPSGRSG